MSILEQARQEADILNAANNYKMLQKANELQAAKQAGAQEVVQGLAAQQAARAAADADRYAQLGAMQAMQPELAVQRPVDGQAGGKGYYTPSEGNGLASWEATRQWLANTKRND